MDYFFFTVSFSTEDNTLLHNIYSKGKLDGCFWKKFCWFVEERWEGKMAGRVS